jgi:hypothetical protein
MAQTSEDTATGQATTLRDAIEAVPEAEWVDSRGTLLTMNDLLTSYSEEQLAQPVAWCEDDLGEQQICARADDGGTGEVLLTMAPPNA